MAGKKRVPSKATKKAVKKAKSAEPDATMNAAPKPSRTSRRVTTTATSSVKTAAPRRRKNRAIAAEEPVPEVEEAYIDPIANPLQWVMAQIDMKLEMDQEPARDNALPTMDIAMALPDLLNLPPPSPEQTAYANELLAAFNRRFPPLGLGPIADELNVDVTIREAPTDETADDGNEREKAARESIPKMTVESKATQELPAAVISPVNTPASGIISKLVETVDQSDVNKNADESHDAVNGLNKEGDSLKVLDETMKNKTQNGGCNGEKVTEVTEPVEQMEPERRPVGTLFGLFNWKRCTRPDAATVADRLRAMGLLSFNEQEMTMIAERPVNTGSEFIAVHRFFATGRLLDRLRWLTEHPEYAVESRRMNRLVHGDDFSSYQYVITEKCDIKLMTFLFLTMQSIGNSYERPKSILLSPGNIQIEKENSTEVLNLAEMISEKWIGFGKTAFVQLNRHGKSQIQYLTKQVGKSKLVWTQ